MNRGSWVSGGCGHRRGRTSPVAPRPVSWLSSRRRMPVRSFAVITAVLSPGCTRHQHTPESCGAREIAHGDRMTFAISLQLPARGTGLAGPAGVAARDRGNTPGRKRRLSRRRPGAHVRALSRLLQPCRHRVIRPACSHPQMPRDPIRMLARVTRSRQRPMNPTLLRERGAVADDGAHQGSDGTRPGGPNSTRSRGPGSSIDAQRDG
jgi:hypothetical protein